jgi:hypothetical protein
LLYLSTIRSNERLLALAEDFLLSHQKIFYQPGNLTGFCMSMGCQLGIQQLPIDGKLKSTTIGWHQGDRFDIRLEFLEQFSCQTDSPIGVVSDCTINQVNFHQHNYTSARL